MSPKESHTPQRTIRVDDETWDAALEAAESRGETVSEAIRKFLKRYAKSGSK